MIHSSILIFTVVCFAICKAGNITEWEERPCILPQRSDRNLIEEPQKNNEVDETIWYFPLYHKYELYQTCSMVSGIPVEELSDDDIKKSCLTMAMEEPDVFITKGFDGKKMEVVTTPDEDGFLWKLKGEKEFRGEFWITLASENYSVAVTCWANGHRSFSAASKTKELDSATRNIIAEHVTLLGFDPKSFYYYSYDECKAERGRKSSDNVFSKITHRLWAFIISIMQ